MPSHKIHMYITKKVNEKLGLDLDSIMLGSVLPDLTINKNHAKSHYQYNGTYESELANPDKFLSEYKTNNPIMIGYLIHLLTDRFYNDYFFKNHCIFNDDRMPYKVKLRSGIISKNSKKYKHKDFEKYDKYLLRNHLIPKFNDINCVDKIPNIILKNFNKKYLCNYIKKANKEVDNSKLYKNDGFIFYKVVSKNEMDNITNKCIDYILKYITEKFEGENDE